MPHSPQRCDKCQQEIWDWTDYKRLGLPCMCFCLKCAPRVELYLNGTAVGYRVTFPNKDVSIDFYAPYNSLRYNWLWRMFEADVTLTHVTDPFEK